MTTVRTVARSRFDTFRVSRHGDAGAGACRLSSPASKSERFADLLDSRRAAASAAYRLTVLAESQVDLNGDHFWAAGC